MGDLCDEILLADEPIVKEAFRTLTQLNGNLTSKVKAYREANQHFKEALHDFLKLNRDFEAYSESLILDLVWQRKLLLSGVSETIALVRGEGTDLSLMRTKLVAIQEFLVRSVESPVIFDCPQFSELIVENPFDILEMLKSSQVPTRDILRQYKGLLKRAKKIRSGPVKFKRSSRTGHPDNLNDTRQSSDSIAVDELPVGEGLVSEPFEASFEVQDHPLQESFAVREAVSFRDSLTDPQGELGSLKLELRRLNDLVASHESEKTMMLQSIQSLSGSLAASSREIDDLRAQISRSHSEPTSSRKSGGCGSGDGSSGSSGSGGGAGGGSLNDTLEREPDALRRALPEAQDSLITKFSSLMGRDQTTQILLLEKELEIANKRIESLTAQLEGMKSQHAEERKAFSEKLQETEETKQFLQLELDILKVKFEGGRIDGFDSAQVLGAGDSSVISTSNDDAPRSLTTIPTMTTSSAKKMNPSDLSAMAKVQKMAESAMESLKSKNEELNYFSRCIDNAHKTIDRLQSEIRSLKEENFRLSRRSASHSEGSTANPT